jgi:DNA-binding transcriptional regulator YhcF (GntR family)
MTQTAVEHVVSYVLDRLVSGLYPPGSRLPTSRDLADELGVHRNTAAKAYKSLSELGVITTNPGRGTFAATRVDPGNRGLHAQQISDRLADAVLRARRGNMPEIDLRRALDEHIAAIYHAPRRGAFVECNTEDLQILVAEIEQQSNVRLAPVLLEALAADAAGVAASYDVIFTSLFHLLEVRELLAGPVPDGRVVGIHAQPDERALAEIAQIEPNARVGIVVSNEDGARRFDAQLSSFTRAGTRVLIRPTDEAITRLAREVDLLVTSRSRAGQIRRLNLGLPLIELAFHISRESANRVVDELVAAPVKVIRDSDGQDMPKSRPRHASGETGPEGRDVLLHAASSQSRI